VHTIASRDGTVIAFDRSGEGSPVLLVGGAFQHRAFDPPTARLAELLASHFTVYHYDRRGRGASGDTAPYAVDREIEDIEALIEAAGDSAYVFGDSSGAVLALRAAGQGLAISKLALYEPPFIVDDSRPPLPTDYLDVLTELVADGRRGDAVEYFMTTAVGLPSEFVDQMRREPFWPAFEAVAHTLPYDAAVMANTGSGSPTPLHQWADLSAPTLVLDGGESQPYQHTADDALAAILPIAERRTLEGQSHEVAPDVLAPALVDFFTQRQPPTSKRSAERAPHRYDDLTREATWPPRDQPIGED
jgi:pimeloyl-ACP methyl ester carboxylesterase